jgi:hypothetical protein
MCLMLWVGAESRDRSTGMCWLEPRSAVPFRFFLRVASLYSIEIVLMLIRGRCHFHQERIRGCEVPLRDRTGGTRLACARL